MSSEVHIMQTKQFISPSVTVFRVIGHKNSEKHSNWQCQFEVKAFTSFYE
jgi:hypothetical protein